MTNIRKPVSPASWEELLTELYADSWDATLQRHRSSFAFRGLADSAWQMPTSLIRLGGDFSSLEKHMLRNFKKYAYRELVERDSFWYWLTIAQHHGLPTRLLDWTWSPFVALHFATNDLQRMGEDGIVWCVNIRKVHSKLPKFLRSELVKEGSNLFTVEMLSGFERPDLTFSIAGTKISSSQFRPTRIGTIEDFDKLVKKAFALFFEPPSIDDRIVNQYALFSVISDSTVYTDDWLKQYPDLYKKVIVSSSLKWEVRDKLDQANVTERVLFPGLDGLSSWLKRHYSPRA